MVFSSVIFLFGFLPAVIFTYYITRLLFQKKLGNALLLLFSYIFYLYGAAVFLPILILSTVADYFLGLMIDRDIKRKQLWLTFSVLLNIGLLIYFKYANFFVGELNSIFADSEFYQIKWTEVLLPIGISFFTFQKLSYVIDVYRGKTPAEHNFIKLAAFVSFFPYLLAGPIERAQNMLPQLSTPPEITSDNITEGFSLFIVGLFKKIALADHPLGLVFEDKIFVCEDCSSKHSREKISKLSKTTMQSPHSGMPIALWLIHEQNRDKMMMTVKK